jgi:hypothetical protein
LPCIVEADDVPEARTRRLNGTPAAAFNGRSSRQRLLASGAQARDGP